LIHDDPLINQNDLVLVTGSNGFIGSKVVKMLLQYGFRNIRCFTRPSSNLTTLNGIVNDYHNTNIEIFQGNLLSKDDCQNAVQGASVIFHLAAGIGKSFPVCFSNSVITTRNLLESSLLQNTLKRFVNVSSFSVYSTKNLKRGALLDERCDIESDSEQCGEAYCYGKVKQEELLLSYDKKYGIPFVILRPGAVFGPGKNSITGRIGIDTFGIFFHLGGSNKIPFTFVDNCAEAIVLAGITKGVDGEIFNIVDDNLPSSRTFLNLYKRNVKNFKSIYIPYSIAFLLCYLWEKYSAWSEGQLPPIFNRRRCRTDWQGNRYSNDKLKTMLGWKPIVPLDEAMKQFFEYCRNNGELL
jgi:nucleoside-diphosphate-sugar epimerase